MAGWMDKLIAKTALSNVEPELAKQLPGLTEVQIIELLKAQIEENRSQYEMVVGMLGKFSEEERAELLKAYPLSKQVFDLAIKHKLV